MPHLILLISTLSFNLHSAMTTAVPKPRFKEIADRNIPDFEKKHGKFLYYPLLQKDTQFCMIDFNRKYDGILQHNVGVLSCRNVKKTIVYNYKITVFAQHYANIAQVTHHSMTHSLPLREVSTNEQLEAFAPFNNMCFYYYPIPTQHHSLDRTKYEKVFKNALQLNLGIAKTRGIEQSFLDFYNTRVLQKLTTALMFQFPRIQETLDFTQSPFTANQNNRNLINYTEHQNQHHYPAPNQQFILNQNIYVLGYCVRMEVTLKQLASLGLSPVEILKYKQNMLGQLNNIPASYGQTQF